ncbi:MAG: diguanylate cyclase [Deltaproteobacteria bacterium]|nr:diguanylate cyclase [Deltaproteobacteria bacterium]
MKKILEGEKTQISEMDIIPIENNLSDVLVKIYPPGTDLGKKWELTAKTADIGRDQDCDITINHNSVSRLHAQLSKNGNMRTLTDLQSTNGTLVNGESIISKTLTSGDWIKIGDTIFKYLTGTDVENAYHEEIYKMTIIDGLTNIYNKRYFMENIQRELARSSRHSRPLSLIMFDIDFFKKINDTYGHLAGDTILQDLSAVVKNRMRKDEILARYGGEEFAVILPESNLESAVNLAENIKSSIENHRFLFEKAPIPVTVSLGVACTSGEIDTEQEFIKMADQKLYQAKQEGRNRVCF